MKSLAYGLTALIAALALAACGGDDNNNPDAGPDGGQIDAPIDGPPGGDTFTSFVINEIQARTTASAEPAAFATFSALPDPDATNPAAYDSLF